MRKEIKYRKLKYFGIVIALLLLTFIIGCGIYVKDYYHANKEALLALEGDDSVSVHTLKNETIIFEPNDATSGFIFYPGGKVEYTAYAPLLRELADNGILCILVKMPFNLAVLDMNAADGIQAQFPNIEHWFIGGHSLGGSMAASYVSKHIESYDGLALLGSYSTADLSHSDLSVLSIYGSEDGVLNKEKYDKYSKNLPHGYMEKVIDGGCHAYFGMYGEQDGDGQATISNEEQLDETGEIMSQWISNQE